MRYVVDTNALILNPDIVDEYEEVVICETVLSELDRIKIESGERGQGARRAVRKLMDSTKVTYDLEESTEPHPDKRIIDCAVRLEATVVTGDKLMYLRAKAKGLEAINIFGKTLGKPDYTGFAVVEMTDEQVANYFNHEILDCLKGLDLVPNQYVLLKSETDGKIIDLYKVTMDMDVIKVRQRGFQSEQLGTFTPNDLYQIMAVDSLTTNQMTILKGPAGTGKSLIALSYAFSVLDTLDKNADVSTKGKNGKAKGNKPKGDKFDKLICFVNPVTTKGAAKLGFYTGNRDEKLLGGQVGSMLTSKLGGKQEVERLIQEEKLVLLPFSDIRGYDTTGMNAIVYILEAQNLDVTLMKLAIQRVGKDSKLIIDGDNNQQVDDVAYSGMLNGMRRASDVFRGEGYFGEVELQNIYRSDLAKKAEEM